MIKTITVYSRATGKIKRRIRMPAFAITPGVIAAQVGPNEGAILGSSDPESDYVDVTASPPMITPRSAINETLQINGQTVALTGLPTPCFVWVDETRYVTADGTLVVDFVLPGDYELRLESPKFVTKSLEVSL